jgi:hypothetical protein
MLVLAAGSATCHGQQRDQRCGGVSRTR